MIKNFIFAMMLSLPLSPALAIDYFANDNGLDGCYQMYKTGYPGVLGPVLCIQGSANAKSTVIGITDANKTKARFCTNASQVNKSEKSSTFDFEDGSRLVIEPRSGSGSTERGKIYIDRTETLYAKLDVRAAAKVWEVLENSILCQ